VKRAFVSALAVCQVLFACAPSHADRPTLFAAASLREAIEELCELYESEGNPKPRLNIAASNLLARQILAGARADLFFSADEVQVDRLEEAGYVAGRRSLLSNRLAVIRLGGDSHPPLRDLSELLAIGRIALANDGVPAGRYARQWMLAGASSSEWANRVVPAVSVRGVLAAVASGAVPAGVVYATDARISDEVRVAFVVEDELAPDISYALALIRGASAPAEELFEFLSGPRAAEVFRRHGFLWRGEQ